MILVNTSLSRFKTVFCCFYTDLHTYLGICTNSFYICRHTYNMHTILYVSICLYIAFLFHYSGKFVM